MLDGRLDPVTCRRWLWRRQDAFERGQHVTGCLLDALHASTEERTPAEAVARVALIEAGQLFNLHLELAPPRQAELLGSRSYRSHGHGNGRTADVACSTVPVSQGHAVLAACQPGDVARLQPCQTLHALSRPCHLGAPGVAVGRDRQARLEGAGGTSLYTEPAATAVDRVDAHAVGDPYGVVGTCIEAGCACACRAGHDDAPRLLVTGCHVDGAQYEVEYGVHSVSAAQAS